MHSSDNICPQPAPSWDVRSCAAAVVLADRPVNMPMQILLSELLTSPPVRERTEAMVKLPLSSALISAVAFVRGTSAVTLMLNVYSTSGPPERLGPLKVIAPVALGWDVRSRKLGMPKGPSSSLYPRTDTTGSAWVARGAEARRDSRGMRMALDIMAMLFDVSRLE